MLFFPHRCFSEGWSVGAGGSGGGGFLWGRFGVRAGVKRKRVIVTELTRKSRGGQCADRTLGCMIHRRGPNMNPLESSSLRQTRPPPPASEAPHHGLTLGGITPKRWRITSRHLLCGRLCPSGVNWHSNLWTTSKQTNITSGLTVFLCSECRHNIAVTAELTVAVLF